MSLARQQDVLEVLAYTARQQNDTLGWLQRSRELVEVCHGQGAETEALRNEAEVGAALCFLGKETEGMAQIDSVIALLDVKKFNELDAMLIVLKRKVMVLAERGHYAEMLPPARQMLEWLSDYEQHSDRYHDSSYREPKDSTDRQDYIEFYRSKAQKYIGAEVYRRCLRRHQRERQHGGVLPPVGGHRAQRCCPRAPRPLPGHRTAV